jgi:predicted enzyme related to lactoylglutathione lyase
MANPASNPVVWFEIYVSDIDRARTFYGTVLGRTFDKLEDPSGQSQMWAFSMSQEPIPGAGGALVKMAGMEPGGNSVLVYFGCADVAVEAARVNGAGGKVEQPKMSIGPYGFIAICKDTEGNTFGLHSMA